MYALNNGQINSTKSDPLLAWKIAGMLNLGEGILPEAADAEVTEVYQRKISRKLAP